MDSIFGYTWEDIQRAQRGGQLSRPIAATRSEPDWSEQDQKALDEHPTEEALRAVGYLGVLDRAKRLGKL